MSTGFEFILFSVLLRVVEGIGSAGYSTSLFAIASMLYPESTGTVMVREGEKQEERKREGEGGLKETELE